MSEHNYNFEEPPFDLDAVALRTDFPDSDSKKGRNGYRDIRDVFEKEGLSELGLTGVSKGAQKTLRAMDKRVGPRPFRERVSLTLAAPLFDELGLLPDDLREDFMNDPACVLEEGDALSVDAIHPDDIDLGELAEGTSLTPDQPIDVVDATGANGVMTDEKGDGMKFRDRPTTRDRKKAPRGRRVREAGMHF